MVKEQVAGMVTLFNSAPAVLTNINTYLLQVDKLFVIDNSDEINDELVASLCSNKQIYYHWNGGNRGIAYALNTGARLARQQNYIYLLTMDDDSRTPEGLVNEMLTFLRTYTDGKVGIVSAAHHKIEKSEPYRVVLHTLTSGNLIDLRIHQQVGEFWEELFIDHVDHEYCLRLNKLGYQVIELSGMLLEHSLGQQKPLPLWPEYLHFVSHHPTRMYYIARNGWLVAIRYWRYYPWFGWTVIKFIVKEWLKALFFEDSRRERIHFLLKGIKDAWKGRMGKLQ